MKERVSDSKEKPTLIEIESKHTIDDHDKPEIASSKSKFGASSFSGVIMICFGTIMYGIMPICGRLSMTDNKYAYNPNAALLIAEFGKFIISFILLIYFQSIYGAITAIKAVPFNEWFLFCIPAIIYSIKNIFDFWCLQYMDPGSLSVGQQIKIITTAIIWRYIFKKPFDNQQYVSLILLCIGCMLVSWPDAEDNIIDTDDDSNIRLKQTTMYVIWPLGPILVICQVFLSAIASICVEFIYKKYGSKRSLFVDNLSLYFWGSIANIIQFYYKTNGDVSIINLLDGFNNYTWTAIIIYILLGISVAYVLKYFNNIVKSFMGALSVIVAGCGTFIMFNLYWTLYYTLGSIMVVSAAILYKLPKRFI